MSAFVCGCPLQEDRDQVKRTRGGRGRKRAAGGAERCAADIRARVVTGSKIGVDLRHAVYRRLISRYEKDLPSAAPTARAR